VEQIRIRRDLIKIDAARLTEVQEEMEQKSLVLTMKAVGLAITAFIAMGVVHFLGGQSLLPWASFFATLVLGLPTLLGSESRLDLTLDLNRTVESKQETPTMNLSQSTTIEWTEDARANLEKVNTNPEWRRTEESEYTSWRTIGSALFKLSKYVQNIRYVNANRIRTILMISIVLGCSWFLLLLSELLASGSFDPIVFSTLAELSPLSYSTSNLPIFQILGSLVLFLLPIGYLDWKTGTTCDECGTPFSLQSKGKYWHSDLKEEKTENGTKTTVYHGVRFRECMNCGKLYQDTNYSWKESSHRN